MSLQYSPLSISITKKLDKTIKKQEGIYFTPPKTIENNIKLLSPYIDNIKNILEPSCGSCEYVLKLNKYPDLTFTCIENNKEIYEQIKILGNDSIKILNQDFLKYEDVKKYDLVIGNPPYFVLQKKEVPSIYYDYFDGRPNMFIIFIIKSLKHLKEGGILSFVLPKSFINSTYYNKARKYIYSNYKILNIINNGEDNYIDTKQETIIFIIQNTPSHNDSINDKYSLNIQDNLIFGTEEDIISIKELLNNSTSLKNLGFNIKVGNVVWNQVKELLTNDEKNTRLIYSTDIENNKLNMKKYKNNEKKNFINKKGVTDPVLVINRGYGIGKYNFNYAIIDYKKEYLVENHLLVISSNEKYPDDILIDKYNEIMKSFDNIKTRKFIEIYFGNNAINTYEILNILPIYDI